MSYATSKVTVRQERLITLVNFSFPSQDIPGIASSPIPSSGTSARSRLRALCATSRTAISSPKARSGLLFRSITRRWMASEVATIFTRETPGWFRVIKAMFLACSTGRTIRLIFISKLDDDNHFSYGKTFGHESVNAKRYLNDASICLH